MSIVVVLTAFAGGLVSFLSPCVLPLVPGYLSIISGYSLDQLKGNAQNAALKRSVVTNSIMFIIGFSITFIALGATATWLGQILVARMQILYRIAGLVIIIFGLHVLGIFKINALYQDKRFHDVQKAARRLGSAGSGTRIRVRVDAVPRSDTVRNSRDCRKPADSDEGHCSACRLFSRVWVFHSC